MKDIKRRIKEIKQIEERRKEFIQLKPPFFDKKPKEDFYPLLVFAYVGKKKIRDELSFL